MLRTLKLAVENRFGCGSAARALNLAPRPSHGSSARQPIGRATGTPSARRRGCQRVYTCNVLLALLACLHPSWGWSANGMVAPGNGTTQLGLAGAGTAMAQDAAATLRNPAAGVWMDASMTADLGIVIPLGGYEASAVGPGSSMGLFEVAPGRDTSVAGVFPSPAFARNWRLNDRQAWGLGVTAAGLKALSRGNTAAVARGLPGFEARCDGDFGGGYALPGTIDPSSLCGSSGSALGVDLTQILVSAHWAYLPHPDISLGLAPVFAFQRLNVRGIGAFADFSNYPDRTTDNKSDLSYGGGLRLGLLWEITSGIGLGLAYQSRIYTSEFDRYRGVIIGGALDFAPIYNIGLQIHVARGHRLLLDVEHIRYADIKPVGHRVDPQRFTDGCFVPRLLTRSLPNVPPLGACLGGPDGPGFGWEDITVYKLGYQIQRGRLTLRAGYSLGGNPVGDDQTLSAAFAPAVTEQHAAIGLSWEITPKLAFSWALIDALPNRVRSRNALSNVNPQVLGDSTLAGFKVEPDPQDQMIESYLSVWQSQFGLTWTIDN